MSVLGIRSPWTTRRFADDDGAAHAPLAMNAMTGAETDVGPDGEIRANAVSVPARPIDYARKSTLVSLAPAVPILA
jgi:hypothetical protein